MQKHIKRILFIILAAGLTACSFSFTNELSKSLPEQVQAEVDRLNTATIARDTDSLFKYAHPNLKKDLKPGTIKAVMHFVIGEKLVNSEIISVSKKTSVEAVSGKQTTYDIKYKLETDGGVMTITYGLLEKDRCCQIYNYRVNLTELYDDDTEDTEESADGETEDSVTEKAEPEE